jgi:lysophospholipase L1-like esterase
MMIHANLEFHNVAEGVADAGGPGLRLQRLPEALRPALNATARGVACCPTHCEIRYVSAAPEMRLTLHSEVHHEYLRVYQGDFFQQEFCLEPGQTRTFCLSRSARLIEHAATLRPDPFRGFSPEVMRVRLSGTGRVRFVHADANGEAFRPPTAAEKPARTLLGYGSSLTQGFNSSRLSGAYLAQAAHLLGVDFLNLGFGGSCHCEPELADHIAARDDWQIAWLEPGVNMLGSDLNFTADQFRQLAGGLLEKVSRDPRRFVVVATIFPGAHDLSNAPRPAEPWRQILRELVAESARPNLRLVEGPDLLDWTGLSSDLIHPADSGHAQIGVRMADFLAPYIETFFG